MTRFPYDEFAKGFFESLLSPFGKVQTSFKIGSEVREVDIYFQPNPQLEPALNLGLLGKLAKNGLIFEPFRNPVKTCQIRFCMGKLYDLHADLFREAKRNKQPEPKDAELPCLWILTPTLSDAILEGYGARLATEFVPTGVYLVSPSFKTGIIVIHQLPKTSETLWFRLLGKGTVQSQAITEVAELPENHPCRQNALDWLGNLKVILESRESLEPEERDLMMQLSPLYLEKIRAAESLGRQEGIQEGRQEGQCELLLRLLNRRVGRLSPDAQDRVKALTLARLEELGEALLDFTGLADLETWLNQLH